MSTISQEISGFISETEPLIEHIEELPPDTVAELYELFSAASSSATENIAYIDPELRVKICDRLDRIVDRIADFDLLPPEHDRERTHVYTPAVQGYRNWGNVELLKDKGLVGYMLAKEIDADAVMFFGTKPEDYPYLSLLPGMEILYNDASIGGKEAYFSHLRENFAKMDVLVFHGIYNEAVRYLDEYRELRPDGKVFCGLDMNSLWMKRVIWDHPDALRFASQCDVIATSCRFMRDVLNRDKNVGFSCRWIPNGFFNPADIKVIADPDIKGNVILTVGRIGTQQKNSMELLSAFGWIAEEIPNWRLRFIGTVEPDFQPEIDAFFAERPELKNRVIFRGAVTDKKELYSEYASAKVFALTSRWEGGTPNVYAEALVHGCMFVTSNIDAADDISNFGELGEKYEMGNIGALSSALKKVCLQAERSNVQKHIPKALDYAAKYFDWQRNIKKLAYMLYN